MQTAFQVFGNNVNAPFTLKIHRGDGMALLAMNWRNGPPSKDFVGFAIEYKEPSGMKYYALKNRLCFPESGRSLNPNRLSTLFSPIQKFRWVHFPRNANLLGPFTYRVTPVFMNSEDELSYGEPQIASLELRRETYPGILNVAFTRGFVSSQAFVERFERKGSISQLLPRSADVGLNFTPTHPAAKEALAWMGFEAREAILELLDEANQDQTSEVFVVAYDLSEAEIVRKLKRLGKRLWIIIDDSGKHGEPHSAESQAAELLKKSAGKRQVKRQHMGSLQHNKTMVINGRKVKKVVCGSTNFSWRGFFVQANNAMILEGKEPVQIFRQAFEDYWASDTVQDFGATVSAQWQDLRLSGIKAKVSFPPHTGSNQVLQEIAGDISKTQSTLFYSLAFLFQTKGVIRDVLTEVTHSDRVFVYGISDKKTGGLDLQKPDGNMAQVFPSALTAKNLPEPFRSEPTGGGGNRMHHKFLVIDFDKPTARVYMGSYNFSVAADTKNGENLLLIKDRMIAVSYMIEAVRLFDHYHFRVAQAEAKKARKKLSLQKPPQLSSNKPWWAEYYTQKSKIKDRELFS